MLSIYIRGIGADADTESEAAVLALVLCGLAIGSTTGPWVRLSRIVIMPALTSLPIRRRQGN